MNRRRFLSLSAVAALLPGVACAETRWTGIALGADCEVTLTGNAVQAARALAALPLLLDAIEADFSLYRAASAVNRLNADGRLDDPSPAFRALMQLSGRVHRLTDGAFDPTVQSLWRASAAGTDGSAAPMGWHRVQTQPPILPSGMALTFNGIAQGFATDAARALFESHGFTRALIQIGETAALGGPFRLAMQDPDHGQLGTVTLTDMAIATSSPFATRVNGHPHIQHPLGLPPLWSTVSVRATSAALADALSTALVFLPRARIAALDIPEVQTVTLVDLQGNLSTL